MICRIISSWLHSFVSFIRWVLTALFLTVKGLFAYFVFVLFFGCHGDVYASVLSFSFLSFFVFLHVLTFCFSFCRVFLFLVFLSQTLFLVFLSQTLSLCVVFASSRITALIDCLNRHTRAPPHNGSMELSRHSVMV